MKLKQITVSSVLGIHYADIPISKPVLVVAGKNRAGKTSLRTAVYMALTGDILRADVKAERGALVRDGAKAGMVSVLTGAGDVTLSLPAGTITGNFVCQAESLRAVLDNQRLIDMDAKERRTFLFGLAGIKITPDEICIRLTQKGCDEKLIAKVRGNLAAGMEYASKAAATSASEARGGWKATTGETYGAVKAGTWKATAEELSADEIKELEIEAKSIPQIETSIAQANRTLGTVQEQARAFGGYGERLAKARTEATGYAKVADDMAALEKALAKQKTKVADLRKRTGTGKTAPAAPKRYTCPSCEEPLMLIEDTAGQKLAAYALPQAAQADPGAASLLLLAEQEEAALQGKIEALRPSLAAADSAARLVQSLEDAPPVAPSASADGMQTAINELTDKLNSARARCTALTAKAAAADQAQTKTTLAAGHHGQVQAWSKIADALGPEGIQADILAQGLGPINARLRNSSIATGWPALVIKADMSLEWDSRPYRLLALTGGSEEWMATAMLAEAISHISGLKLLMLDNFDHMLPAHRIEAILWLDQLAQECEIDTAILLMAAKQRPSGLPDTCDTVWLEAGSNVAAAAEAEAAA